ncbi:helix-turn-helix transcriptional regulator [Mycolicibacterium thermoresistibile]|nr:helix-turn-helix transcriptional regulator [Mycolicibacterium thermoresistibile]GAT15547.1 LuxR family transcriptional regulator [Mycolicibacterium thermoresistibile]SNW16902.1 two-component system response regulator [Mycolicibacterium thermoresistibile]
MRTLSKKSSTQWTPPAVMTAEDYRCAFDIVSDCHDSSTLNEFREALVESLCRHLSIPNVSFFSGATFNQVFEDESPLTEGATRKMLPEYQDRWARHDVFGSPAAVRQLLASTVSSLNELKSQHRLPATAVAYIRHFLHGRWDMGSAAAMQLPLSRGRTALVGFFSPHPEDLGPRELAILRLVGNQLSPVSRRLPAEPALRVINRLTERQRDVAKLVADGLSNAEIADILCLAEDTVKKYVTRILHQTACRSRLELALIIRDAGL